MTAEATALGAHLFWPVERWRALQAERLAVHIRHAAMSPLYRKKGVMPEAGGSNLSAESLDSVVAQLPLTTKNELSAAGSDAWAVAPGAVAEWVCTSGTSGKPLDVPLTARDLERLAENEAVALDVAGVRRGDLFLLAVGMDRLFVAGLAYWLGAQRLGATCVRVGPQVGSHPEMLADLMRRFDAKGSRRAWVIAVPSFLSDAIPPAHSLAGIIGIGEPLRTESLAYNILGERLSARFGCPVLSTYAATETCTTFAEGPLCRGGHLNPALAMVEILDEAGQATSDGQVGEVVVTPLGVEGMPLVRFRTGDMASLFGAPCACGRTTPRLGPILGRRQQLLKLRGTNVFPSAILEAVQSAPEVTDCVIVAEQDASLGDAVTVFVHARDEHSTTREKIEARLRALLRVTPPVRLVSGEVLKAMQSSPSSRKVQRFIDRRPEHGDRG